jgi:hypothetical protein
MADEYRIYHVTAEVLVEGETFANVYHVVAEVLHGDDHTELESHVYHVTTEILHSDQHDLKNARVQHVALEVLRAVEWKISPQPADDPDEIHGGFHFQSGVVWKFIEDSDVVHADFSYRQARITIPDRERNPYPAHPDRAIDEFVENQQRILREQHNQTQAGDSTFDYGLLLKGTPDKLYTLGSLGRFYHDKFGLILARYVQFKGCVETVVQGVPVGYLNSSHGVDWIVTNDLNKSSSSQVMGVMCLAETPADGTYGWIVTEGAVPVPMLQDSSILPAPATPYVWSRTGTIDIGVSGKILGLRWGRARASHPTAGTVYIRLEGMSPKWFSEWLAEELIPINASLATLDGRLTAAEATLVTHTSTLTTHAQQIVNLDSKITTESKKRARDIQAIRQEIGVIDWSAEIAASSNAVRSEFATADDLLRQGISQALYRANQAYTIASGGVDVGLVDRVQGLESLTNNLRIRLNELSFADLIDVDTTTNPPNDGDVPTWDAGNSKWIPAAPTGGGGGGGGDPDWVRYAVANPGDGFIDVPLDDDNGQIYEVVVSGIPSANCNVSLLISNDNGTSFLSASDSYKSGSTASTSSISINEGVGSGRFVVSRFTISGLNGGINPTRFGLTGSRWGIASAGTANTSAIGGGANSLGTDDYNAFRIQVSSGNMDEMFVDVRRVFPPLSIGSSTAWVLIDQNGMPTTDPATWTWSTNVTEVDVTGLGNYNELLVIAQGITSSTSQQRSIRVSTDNGATFHSTVGDYISITDAGVASNSTIIGVHDGNSTAARTLVTHIRNLKGPVKSSFSNYNPGHLLFVGSPDDISAIRFSMITSGNLTGGTLHVYAR